MATPSRLARPPIKEALVDFRTERALPLDPDLLKPLWPAVKDRLPHLEVRNRMQAHFAASKLGQPPDAKAEDLGFHGLFLKPKDESRFVQFRTDGFTFSQLSGYTSADDLFAEALDLWDRFVELSRPDKIIRVALRFINRLELGFNEGDDFDRFLRAAVTTPADTPQTVFEFMTRTVMPLTDGTIAVVTQRLEPKPPGEERVPFVLDVDVFRMGDFPMTKDGLLPVLQSLRELKNQLFFAFVTDAALEMYR